MPFDAFLSILYFINFILHFLVICLVNINCIKMLLFFQLICKPVVLLHISDHREAIWHPLPLPPLPPPPPSVPPAPPPRAPPPPPFIRLTIWPLSLAVLLLLDLLYSVK